MGLGVSRISAILCSFFLAGCGGETAETGQAAGGVASQPEPRADRFTLERPGDGEVRIVLAGVRAADPGFPEADEAAAMRDAFLAAAGADLVLEDVVEGGDRYGRRIVHMRNAQGDWLQAQLVEAGLAAVSSLVDSASAPALLDAEAAARTAGRGGWGSGAFAILPSIPDALLSRSYSEQLVEGVILAAAEARDGRVYLNFGSDWRSDFTIMIPAAARDAVQAAHGDALALEGARVRVRGWLRDENGPMIVLERAIMLEVLDGYANPLNSPE